jgi:hypothetical protein
VKAEPNKVYVIEGSFLKPSRIAPLLFGRWRREAAAVFTEHNEAWSKLILKSDGADMGRL